MFSITSSSRRSEAANSPALVWIRFVLLSLMQAAGIFPVL